MVELLVLLVLLAWVATGTGLASLGIREERGAGSVAGGALLGPLWWVVIADRRALAAASPSRDASSDAERQRRRTA